MKIEMGKKYRYEDKDQGPAEILTTTRQGGYPVVSMTTSGQLIIHKIDGKAWASTRYDLVEASPWDDFKDGDPVMVRDHNFNIWKRRYFAGVEDGKALTYDSGTTKWTAGGTVSWNYCRRPTPEELKE